MTVIVLCSLYPDCVQRAAAACSLKQVIVCDRDVSAGTALESREFAKFEILEIPEIDNPKGRDREYWKSPVERRFKRGRK
jgi:hypothetical protein